VLNYVEYPSKDGAYILRDLRRITSNGLLESFPYSQEFFNYETYSSFAKESTFNISLALAAIFVIMLTLTANLKISCFILICVGLVDLFLFALMVFWQVSYNTVTGLNIVLAIGLAVDYSAHIGHSYLVHDEPLMLEGRELSDYERR